MTMLPPIWVERLGEPEEQERPVPEDLERAAGRRRAGRRGRRRAAVAAGVRHEAVSARGGADRGADGRIAAPVTNPASRRSRLRRSISTCRSQPLAAQPDVGAEPVDEPLVAAAGMGAAGAAGRRRGAARSAGRVGHPAERIRGRTSEPWVAMARHEIARRGRQRHPLRSAGCRARRPDSSPRAGRRCRRPGSASRSATPGARSRGS